MAQLKQDGFCAMLTQKRLHELLDYEPETGIFRRKYATRQHAIGSQIGWIDRHGHRYIHVDGTDYRASRLAALYMTGELPPKALNHKDRNNANDAWYNLTDKRVPIDQEYLKKRLHYDPDTGVFTWIAQCKGIVVGSTAGSTMVNGYVSIGLDTGRYLAHRLAWLYMTGSWPEAEVDHKDGDPSNNKWSNLRTATRSQNAANSKIKSTNMIGLKGVVYYDRDGFYYSRVTHNGKDIYIGRYPTKEEAHEAYLAAARKHFGEYARAG